MIHLLFLKIDGSKLGEIIYFVVFISYIVYNINNNPIVKNITTKSKKVLLYLEYTKKNCGEKKSVPTVKLELEL